MATIHSHKAAIDKMKSSQREEAERLDPNLSAKLQPKPKCYIFELQAKTNTFAGPL
jgi:hypothetical protein